MRVLHVAPSIARAFGGPTQSLIGYARASLTTGAEVTIAAPATASAEETSFRQALPGVQLHPFPSWGRGAFIASPTLLRWLRDEVRSYDVVHVHGLFNPISSFAARTSLERGVSTVIRPFGTLSRYTFEHRRTRLKRMYYRWVESANLKHAAALHFTTAAERDEASRLDMTFRDRAHVVPPPWVVEMAVEKSSELPRGHTVLFLSRLHPVKRVDCLLDAWPKVLAVHRDARLVIAGEGEERYVRSLTDSRQRRRLDSVEFVGFVSGEGKARLLSAADVFVLPSQHENFGIALLEALASGIPAVVTPEVQLSSFVREHSLGVVSEATPAALAAAINGALSDDAMRQRCLTQAPALIARSFSEDAIGARLGKMYETALNHMS
jgi:glycosyltransferase involved in cell wall biosynthesis